MTRLAARSSLDAAPPAAEATDRAIARDPGDRRRDMKNLVAERPWTPLRIEGRLPEALRGTLVRTGPGTYESFGRRISHSFEADAAVQGVRLPGDGTAQGAARFVESAGLLAERAAGKPLFGSRAPWWRRVWNGVTRRTKNTGNTAMLAWQSRLFAMVESSAPTELDPDSLATRGATDLGVVRGGFSAHPHRLAERRTTIGFGLEYGPRNQLHLYDLPDEGAARHLGTVSMKRPVLLHDFAVTPRHALFLVSPVEIRIPRVLLGAAGLGDMIAWRPEHGVEVIVAPLDAPHEAVRFEVEPFFQWHFAGAYEERGELVAHIARYPDFHSFEGLRSDGVTDRAVLTEVRVDPAARRMNSEPIWDGRAEFPELDPRVEGGRYRSIFLPTELGDGSFRRGVARFDVGTRRAEIGPLPSGHLVSEPIFVPRSADAPEGDGFVLAMVFDDTADASHLAVFDTTRLPDGPIARAHFPEPLPMTFHGVWMPG